MLIGEYTHRLDTKRRVSLPAKMRRNLGERVVITRGLDKCLFLYTSEEWDRIASKLSKLPMGQSRTRQFVRMMLAGAEEVEVDSLGRVLLPEHLKSYASLEEEVVITGVFNRVELWSRTEWENYRSTIEKRADELAEELGAEGLF